jgi:Fic-DOC domain mobile mystery protein B
MGNLMIENPTPGNTPLDPDEMAELIPRYVTTQSELNQVEQANILEAMTWVMGRSQPDLLTDAFLRELHKRMFKDVWKWAGKYRKSLKNLGVSAEQIPVEIKKLCEDTQFWIKNKTYPWDEIGVRFHHRLVAIHPFPNGNGRHARLATDILMRTNGQKVFTWGGKSESGPIDTAGTTRDEYLAALKAADKGDFKLLLDFVRS